MGEAEETCGIAVIRDSVGRYHWVGSFMARYRLSREANVKSKFFHDDFNLRHSYMLESGSSLRRIQVVCVVGYGIEDDRIDDWWLAVDGRMSQPWGIWYAYLSWPGPDSLKQW